MLITLERNSGRPVFRQITEQVRFQVATGLLAPGTALPSTRDLAARLRINPMTVSKAYAALEQEGVLERRPGLALVVRGRPGEARVVEKQAELARLLKPAVTASRQLGLSTKEALDVYRQVLLERGGRDERE